ncbi:MAG: magnesium transporter [Ruminococcaceae bacterium]|nr:magnesium transporter [Oscillospiraceae bacterium]
MSEINNERDYIHEILALIESEQDEIRISKILEEYHDNDIAGAFERLEAEHREKLHRALGDERMSDIISYIDDAGEYISELDAESAADIIENMDPSEAIEILDELDDERKNELLELIEDPEVIEDIELIESYDEDVFGSRMSTNFIAVKRTDTIKGAMRTLIAEAAENDNIYTVFVTDADDSFYGAIDLKDLIVARSDAELESLIYTTFPFVYDTDSIAESIEYLRGYSEDMIPVISSESRKLLGVITSKDVIELVDEQISDDYAKLAAMSSEQEPDEKLFTSMKKRVPWLIALLFMGLAVSVVVGLFEGVVDQLPMIVAFQSLILGMAGNVGTQSLAVTVRALGKEDEKSGKKQLMTIAKEVRVALLNGIALGILSFVIVTAYMLLFSSYELTFTLSAAVCVGLAMCFAMAISGLTGSVIPITLYRIGIDPAVASGPLITTVNDLVAVLSYYGLAWGLLLNL